MPTNLNLQDFYNELESNPDLRRLGKYKIIVEPTDATNLEIKKSAPLTDVYLGEGDFTDVSVNFTDTLIRNLHLGKCNFSELYLNESNISVFNLAQVQAKKLLFGKSEIFIALLGDSKIDELKLGAGKINDLVGQEAEVGNCVFEGKNIKRIAHDWAVIKNIVYEFQNSEQINESFAGFAKTKDEADKLKSEYDSKSAEILGKVETTLSNSGESDLLSTKVKTLTLKEFYIEIEENPDLRRLGPYKIQLPQGEIIFPIDIKLPGKDIHLGHGDFKEVFVAFCETVANSVNLGDSEFSDFYLDRLYTTLFDFNGAKGSRVYFDLAKIHTTRFGESNVGEVFFDIAQLHTVEGENSKSGLFFTEESRIKSFDEGRMIARGEKYDKDRIEGRNHQKNIREENLPRKIYTLEELKHEMENNPDLRRLGPYKVVDETLNHQLNLDLGTEELYLGDGDFTSVGELLLNVKCERVNFGKSEFEVLNMGLSESESLDLEISESNEILFNKSKVGNLYFADSTINHVKFDESNIDQIYGERASVKKIELNDLTAERVHLGNINSNEIRCGKAAIEEVLLSRGDGVRSMFFENSEIDLVNFHEGRLVEVDFGNSIIRITSILRASIDELKCQELRTEAIIFSQEHFKNRIGRADFGDMKGIGGIYMDVFLDKRAVEKAYEGEEKAELKNFGKLEFGKLR